MLIDPRTQQRRQWLAELFGDAGFDVHSASDDASFRSYYRVRSDAPPRGAACARSSYILMDAPPGQENCRPFMAITTRLAEAGLNVPEILAADPERGFLLLSDLGEHDYLCGLDEHSADNLYEDALRALVTMQCNIGATGLAPYCATVLTTEMQLFPDWFLTRHLQLEPDRELQRILNSSFKFLSDACLEQPTVFVHRDYHSRNLMQTAEANPGILDYQDALYGPISYDLVSLLRDAYIHWPDSRIQYWLDRYHALACKAGLLEHEDRPSLVRWFDLTGIQRHLKVAGIFARLYYRDHKARYLADIPLTLNYLLSVAGRYPELADLTGALERLDIIEANQRASAGNLPEFSTRGTTP